MQPDNPLTPQPRQPSWQSPRSLASTAKAWFKKPVVLAVVGLVLVAGAIGAGRLTHKLVFTDQKNENAETAINPSLTLYYRDGKTLLWSSKNGDDKTNPSSAFATLARNELEGIFGKSNLEKHEFRVTTTLDLGLQQAAREQMLAQKDQLTKQRADDATFMAQNVTNGQILSFVDGWQDVSGSLPNDYSLQKIEVGTLMLPFDYAAYLEQNPTATADTQFDDSNGPLAGGFPCTRPGLPTQNGNCLHNLDYKYLGPMSLRQALGGGRLVPAVKAVVGNADNWSVVEPINGLLELVEKMGSDAGCYMDPIYDREDEVQCYGASLFGNGLYANPTGILQAYATLANNGVKVAQTSILAMTIDGKKQPSSQQKGERAISEKTAQTLVDVLKDASASYVKSASFAFTTAKGLKTGAVTGAELGGQSFGAMQFSSRHVAGFWVRSGEQKLAGFMERPVYSVTSNWLDATQ